MKPNALEKFISDNGLKEFEVMNALQDEGVVSANCVRASEVVDDENAVLWLLHRQAQG